MRISSTDTIDGERVLYTIGKIEAGTAWHGADGAPRRSDWRELTLRELIRKAEDLDADAVIGLNYEITGVDSVDGPVAFKRIVATGVAVKLSLIAETENADLASVA
jgi:uncharacterized protein YbjQ (UPF0145 family)